MSKPHHRTGRGPVRADQLRAGDRYEVSQGHPYYCAPTGGDGARGVIAGALVLDSDPAVDSAGVDAGYQISEDTMRAPDIAVGGVPDAPGWVKGGVPPLAVEYAGSGQDDEALRTKIVELLEAGTRWIWVVRLVGPRRVEVHSSGAPMTVVGPGEVLEAPGVLRNAVPVEALYERGAAHEVALRNLLQRSGYVDLDAVRDEGREEGREKGREEGREVARRLLVELVLRQVEDRFPELSVSNRARIEGASLEVLHAWSARVSTAANAFDLLGDAPD